LQQSNNNFAARRASASIRRPVAPGSRFVRRTKSSMGQ
jgi:hypothetical protein